jgi:hypothetical protein
MKKRIIDKIVETILDEDIMRHEHELCDCDLTDDGYGLCFAGAWIEGLTTSEQILLDLGVLTKEEVDKLKVI